jgi:hypothetical protein
VRGSVTKAGSARPGRRHSQTGFVGVGAILLMASVPSCTAQSAAPASVQLVCSVTGAKSLPDEWTSDAVCAEMKREIDRALSRPVTDVKSIAAIGNTDWIRVDVKFTQPATAAATVVQRIGAREVAHPEIAVDVMDKSLGAKEIKLLAGEVARAVAKATKA